MLEISSKTRAITTVVFFVYLLFLVGIGFYSKWSMNKQEKAKGGSFINSFYTGGRSMGPIVVGMMIGASMCSAGTFVSGPGLGYKVGLTWVITILSSAFLNFIILGAIGKKIGIISRRIDAVSYVSLLRSRYNNNKVVGVGAAIAVIIFFTAYVASQFIGGARLMEPMTGLSYKTSLLLFALVVLIYTVLGGTKGVSLSIAFQGFIMTAACFLLLFSVIGKINESAGGMQFAFQELAKSEPAMLTPWTYSLQFQFSSFVMFGIAAVGWPHTVQGTLTYKDTKSMHGAIIVGIIVVAIWQGVMTSMGPLAKLLIPNLEVADYATQYLALNTLPAVGAGVIMAGAAGAIQSTVAAMILIVSSSIVKDLYLTYINPKASSKTIKKFTLISTSLLIIVVFLLSLNPPSFLQLLINFALGGLASTFFISMLLGIYWKRANEHGAMASMASGFIYYFLASTLIKELAFGMQPVLMSLVVSLISMVAVSYITPKSPKGVIMLWFGKNYYSEQE